MESMDQKIARLLVKVNILLGQTPMDPMEKAEVETMLDHRDVKQWIREHVSEITEQVHG